MEQQMQEGEKKASGFRHALVVDDNPAVVAAIATRLMTVGWVCVTALDGHDAMALMSKHTIDAIITDIDMPYVDGFGIIELALSFQKRPVLAITGSGESFQRCRRDYPDVPVLSKPFTGEQILAFITGLDSDHDSDNNPAIHAA